MSFHQGLPTPANIALALIVLKSKPFDLAVEDYIQSLRSAIVSGVEMSVVEKQRHLDGVKFWKEAFEKSQREQSELHDKIFELEQKIKGSPARYVLPLPSGNKKRAVSAAVNKANTQSKRRKPTQKNETGGRDEEEEEEAGFEGFPEGSIALLRAYHSLCEYVRGRSSSATTAASLIRRSSLVAANSVKGANNQSEGDATHHKLTENCRVVQQIWTAIMACARKPKPKSKLTPEPISQSLSQAAAFLGQRILGQLHQRCLDEVDQREKNKKRRPTKSNTNATRVGRNTNGSGSEGWNEACTALAETLAHMYKSLSLDQDLNSRAFEGLLCVFLDHLGSSLSLSVFGDASAPRASRYGLSPPTGLIDVAHLNIQTALSTTQIEAPFLVYILRQVMRRVNRSAGGGDIEPPTATSVPSEITVKSRERLQSTLLRGIFGDEDETFVDPLRRVEAGDVETAVESDTSPVEMLDDPQWLLKQVWENLGWDVLVSKYNKPL